MPTHPPWLRRIRSSLTFLVSIFFGFAGSRLAGLRRGPARRLCCLPALAALVPPAPLFWRFCRAILARARFACRSGSLWWLGLLPAPLAGFGLSPVLNRTPPAFVAPQRPGNTERTNASPVDYRSFCTSECLTCSLRSHSDKSLLNSEKTSLNYRLRRHARKSLLRLHSLRSNESSGSCRQKLISMRKQHWPSAAGVGRAIAEMPGTGSVYCPCPLRPNF